MRASAHAAEVRAAAHARMHPPSHAASSQAATAMHAATAASERR